MSRHAEVKISENKIFSPRFDDLYFSKDDGFAESRYVFLEGNNLPQRWQGNTRFCIAETGFGSGLNFLVALQSWLDDPKRCQRLDYFSIEAYPLRREDLIKVYAAWPQFKTLTQTLIAQYPIVTSGCHSLEFANGKVCLHLIFEEIGDALKRYLLKPDCWFLDGFSPAKNPQMWRKTVIDKIAELSNKSTSLATFTAAGDVRRRLIHAGFSVQKRTGFGRKREMLIAVKANNTKHKNTFKQAPWFALPTNHCAIQTVAVIGAGVAGAQSAYHLAKRGVKVTVFETEPQIASGASGNQAGLLAPKINAQSNASEQFYLSAFLYQLRQIESLTNAGHDVQYLQQGLVQLAHNRSCQDRFEKLAKRRDIPSQLLKILSAQKTSDMLGEAIEHPAMQIQLAASIAPKKLCQVLLSRPEIVIQRDIMVSQIKPKKDCVTLFLGDGTKQSFNAVIVANGHQAAHFIRATDIIPVRGQSSSAELSNARHFTQALGHEGYVIKPSTEEGARPDRIIFGATYKRGDDQADLRSQDTKLNIESLQRFTPNLANNLRHIEDSHAGIRATTSDRWPIVGPVPEEGFYKTHYADLNLGKQYQQYPTAQYKPGIYVLSGLGSRGLTSAAYCANLLTNMVLGHPPPASEDCLRALHPARFMVRDLIKMTAKP